MKKSTTPLNNDPGSQDLLNEILRAISSIQYGSVEIVIHDNQVVQIECREKIRIHRTDPLRRIK